MTGHNPKGDAPESVPPDFPMPPAATVAGVQPATPLGSPAATAPVTPGQAARSAWNDHWAGPDPYPAGQTQEETFDALWADVAQAAILAALVDAGVARLHAENGELRADLDGLRLERAAALAQLGEVLDEFERVISAHEPTSLTSRSDIAEWRQRAGLEQP